MPADWQGAAMNNVPNSFLRLAALAGCLLAGCSAQLLEEVGEISVPRLCSETTKLFNAFSMRAKSVAWKGGRAEPTATLTLELVFDNEKTFPIALSNSGNGVLYAVTFGLRGEKGNFAPKEASGVALVREPKKFNEPHRPGPFGYTTRPEKKPAVADQTKDVNYRIAPGNSEEGKLVFQVPRANYLLSVERKFDNKPVSAQPTDHLAACKISSE
jgi:hypothetical protein